MNGVNVSGSFFTAPGQYGFVYSIAAASDLDALWTGVHVDVGVASASTGMAFAVNATVTPGVVWSTTATIPPHSMALWTDWSCDGQVDGVIGTRLQVRACGIRLEPRCHIILSSLVCRLCARCCKSNSVHCACHSCTVPASGSTAPAILLLLSSRVSGASGTPAFSVVNATSLRIASGAAVVNAPPTSVQSMAASDVNGDGSVDVLVLMNNGSGYFTDEGSARGWGFDGARRLSFRLVVVFFRCWLCFQRVTNEHDVCPFRATCDRHGMHSCLRRCRRGR